MKNKKEPSFEEAMSRLESIAEQLESDDIALENITSLYEEGIHLSNACKKILNDTENKIKLLTQSLSDPKEES